MVTDVKERSADVFEEASRSTWLERVARAGLATRGLLYLVVAVGLAAYGVYSLGEARFRRVGSH